MSRPVILSAVLLGATSLWLQVVVARELLTSFLGNEVSIAVVLVAWLALVGLGSALGGRLLTGRAEAAAPWLQVGVAAALLPSVWLAQVAGGAGRLPGEIVAPGAMLAYAVAALALPCCLLGAQFAVLSRVAQERRAEGAAAGVYAWEAAGAMAAGLAFHLLLAEHLRSSQSMLLAASANLAAAGWSWRGRPWAVLPTVLAAAAGMALVAINPGGLFGLDRPGLARRWRGLEVLAEENSRYGNLAVVREGEQLTFYEGGLPAFSTEARQADEVAIHTPLLMHPAPRRVLIVSGGLGGALGEALRHPVERADYVEMDRRVVELARRLLPTSLRAALDDPRVRLHCADGRAYVRACAARYDVIVLLTPDPATAALSRFYTKEFFRELRRLVDPEGLVCLGLTAAQAKLSGPRAYVHATVYWALREVFPEVRIIPGERTQYLAATSRRLLAARPETLAARMRARGLRPTFANEGWFRTALAALPMEIVLRSLASVGEVPANADARPLSCHYWLRLWLEERSPAAAAGLEPAARALRFAWLLVPLTAPVALLRSRRRGLAAFGAATSLCAVGFLQMGAQLSLILAYQAVAGYLYHQIGILMALFMLGLALGSWLGRQPALRGERSAACALAGLVTLQAASVLGLPLLLRMEGLGTAPAGAIFGAAALWLGGLGGAAFPLGVTVAGTEASARLYALDLAGAALGALVVGALAIPAAGIGAGCATAAAVSLAGAAPLLLAAFIRREVPLDPPPKPAG